MTTISFHIDNDDPTDVRIQLFIKADNLIEEDYVPFMESSVESDLAEAGMELQGISVGEMDITVDCLYPTGVDKEEAEAILRAIVTPNVEDWVRE